MKSILPIDETWTITSFKRTNQNADEILRLNNLPNPSCPNASIEYQAQEAAQAQMEALARDGYVPVYAESNQVNATKANMQDDIRAYTIAAMDREQFLQYQTLGNMPGNLIIPSQLVDEVNPIPSHIQARIFKESTMPPIQTALRAGLPQPDIPFSDINSGVSSDDWYWKPTGDVTFQIAGQAPMEIPCFPESVSDSNSATWSEEMTTYQHYEPKNTYNKSGPRTVSCTFKIHRAMWDGNQDSGKSEALVAYMQSALYPDYDTQAAEPPRCTLIVGKSIRIVGILQSCNVNYSGPIGPDDKYDCVNIDISIKEESDNVLSTSAVRDGLAGWR